jgi:hypothetical protein
MNDEWQLWPSVASKDDVKYDENQMMDIPGQK